MTLLLQAARVSERVRNWLHDRAEGTVHSLFRRVCNLDWGDWVVSLHTAATGRLPGGIEVEGHADFSRLDLRPGQPAIWKPDEECLNVGSQVLSLRGASQWAGTAAPMAGLPAPSLLEARLQLLLRLLGTHGRGPLGAQATGATANDGGIIQEAAARAVWARGMRLYNSLLNGDETAIGPGVAALLGLGEGLTPSGDDLILGMMAALSHARLTLAPSVAACVQRLNECVDDLAPQATTRISSNYLRLGCLGEFSERLGDATQALLGETAGSDEVGPLIARLLESGHSSGTDSATGLYLGVTLLMAQQRSVSDRGSMQ